MGLATPSTSPTGARTDAMMCAPRDLSVRREEAIQTRTTAQDSAASPPDPPSEIYKHALLSKLQQRRSSRGSLKRACWCPVSHVVPSALLDHVPVTAADDYVHSLHPGFLLRGLPQFIHE